MNVKHLKVEKRLADKLEYGCAWPSIPDCGRGEVIFDKEVVFDDGNRMAIQVIASETPDTEPCWSQGVLFDSVGNELGCTDVGETFLGEYTVDEYTTMVGVA